MSVLGACWCRPILGIKSILGTSLFWGERSILGRSPFLVRKICFWSTHNRWQESSMQKKKENQCGPHAERPNYVRGRVFDKDCNDYKPIE